MSKIKALFCIITLSLMTALCACSTQSFNDNKSNIDYDSLKFIQEIELKYAQMFSVDEYEDVENNKYYLIKIDEQKYLVIPKGQEIPNNMPKDIVALKQPFDKTYLVSSSVMDFIRQLSAMDNIRLTGTKKNDWYIEEAKELMDSGDIIYAGKYSAPDYETIINEECNLVIENTMIFHSPKVKEKLEQMSLPVIVEKSSYEKHPLGRLEWIKLYGILYNSYEEAKLFFDKEIEKIEPVMKNKMTDKKVAFFYVTSNGAVNVRKPNDYISEMIRLAGGSYALDNLMDYEENAMSSTNIQMEDFYVNAKDADILIYNSTVDGELDCIDNLIAKNELFKDFKAVKDSNVYCTGSNFYQQTTGICDFIYDLNDILVNDSKDNHRFIFHLK